MPPSPTQSVPPTLRGPIKQTRSPRAESVKRHCVDVPYSSSLWTVTLQLHSAHLRLPAWAQKIPEQRQFSLAQDFPGAPAWPHSTPEFQAPHRSADEGCCLWPLASSFTSCVPLCLASPMPQARRLSPRGRSQRPVLPWERGPPGRS